MQNPTWHDLKIWPIFFKDTFKGIKTFEYRVNDRDYKKGDYLVLREYDPKTEHYSGRQVTRKIIYIFKGHFLIYKDMIIMGVEKV